MDFEKLDTANSLKKKIDETKREIESFERCIGEVSENLAIELRSGQRSFLVDGKYIKATIAYLKDSFNKNLDKLQSEFDAL